MTSQKHPKLSLSFDWLGLIPFEKSLKIQKQFKDSAQKSHFHFVGFEPEKPVISLGLKADESHIFWNEKKLKPLGFSIVKVKRGGEATLHSPGQLVIYPVINLRYMSIRVKDFITALQSITQNFLKEYDIETKADSRFAGLYTKKGKIAFFGIHISEGVSQSGLSINVDNNLNLFESIKSCGETKRPHDKITFYSSIPLNKEELFLKWCYQALHFFNQKKPLKII